MPLQVIERDHGTVRFEIAPSKAKDGAGDGHRYALLNGDPVYLVMMPSRNNELVTVFKSKLIAALRDARMAVEAPAPAAPKFSLPQALQIALNAENRAENLDVGNPSPQHRAPVLSFHASG